MFKIASRNRQYAASHINWQSIASSQKEDADIVEKIRADPLGIMENVLLKAIEDTSNEVAMLEHRIRVTEKGSKHRIQAALSCAANIKRSLIAIHNIRTNMRAKNMTLIYFRRLVAAEIGQEKAISLYKEAEKMVDDSNNV